MPHLIKKPEHAKRGGRPSSTPTPDVRESKRLQLSTRRSPQRIEFYSDIIITAVEGGINYWAYVHNYEHETCAGTYAMVGEIEKIDDENLKEEDWHRVDLDTIAKAFSHVNREPIKNLHEDTRTRYKKAYIDQDAGDLDAGDCDNLIQIALFKEIIYA